MLQSIPASALVSRTGCTCIATIGFTSGRLFSQAANIPQPTPTHQLPRNEPNGKEEEGLRINTRAEAAAGNNNGWRRRRVMPVKRGEFPRPQYKSFAHHPRKPALALMDYINKDIANKKPERVIGRKILFALTPTTPPHIAAKLFKQAQETHCVDYRILNAYMRIISDTQDIKSMQEVIRYMATIGYSPQFSHYSYMMKCWIGPKELDLSLLDTNFANIKKLVPLDNLQDIYATYLSVYVHYGKYEAVSRIMKAMKDDGVMPNSRTYNHILDALVATNSTQETVEAVLLQMDKENIAPDRGTCNIAMRFYMKKGNIDRVLRICELMESKGMPFYDESFMPLIDGFREIGNMEGILSILEEMQRRKINMSNSIFTSVIAAYTEKKEMHNAVMLLDTMKERNVTPASPTYNCLIKGYLNLDDLSGALEILKRMKENKVSPDTITYPQFIEYFRMSDDLSNAKIMLQYMKREGLQPNIITFSGLISLATKLHGFGTEAKELLAELERDGIQPDSNLFGSVATAICARGEEHKIFDLLDAVDQRNYPYHAKFISFPLFKLTRNHQYEPAWDLMCRIMLHRFDLKTLPLPQKNALKMLGFMHPIEDGNV